MRLIVTISRVIVGSLFIVSGLIKSNDALGFMYKLEEYFEPGALNLEFLTPFALELSVFIVIGEILLGVALLVGALPKLTSVLTLVMMLFFTWLTWYTDQCDPMGTKMIVNAAGEQVEIANQCVLECGCFGNAIPLTPHESFLKDIFLLIFVIPIFFGAFTGRIRLNTPRESIYIYSVSILITAIFAMTMLDWLFPPLFTALCLIAAAWVQRRVKHRSKEYIMALAVLLVAGVFQYRTLAYLPMKDYRPYAIGQNILENMKSAEELGLEPPKVVTIYVLVNSETGEEVTIDSDEYLKDNWWQRTEWEIDEDRISSKTISKGYEALIKDFEVVSYDGEDYTYAILEEPGFVFLHISNNLSATKAEVQPKLTALAAAVENEGHAFYALTNGSFDEVEEYRHEHQAAYPFFNVDQTELKIIIRSNPGLVLIKNGVVLQKWSARELPSWEEVSALLN